MDRVRMTFAKWGGLPHWEFDALRLGEDEHGTWLGAPTGTTMSRPGAVFRNSVHQVVLVPDAGYVASFYAPGGCGPNPCEVYVDISTVPRIETATVDAVDLDLDVVRGWTGRVWVDDEDEFAAHRVELGYPRHVVELALATCESVRRAVVSARAPFDPSTSRRWFDVLDEAMMAT